MLRKIATTSVATLVAATFSASAMAHDHTAGDRDRSYKDKDDKTVATVLKKDDRFSKFHKALRKADMKDALSDEGHYTVFAPTNEAFETVPNRVWSRWMDGEDEEGLRETLSYHIVEERVDSGDIDATESNYRAMDGNTLRVSYQDNAFLVNSARVVEGDIDADNGIIHAVDTVLTYDDRYERYSHR